MPFFHVLVGANSDAVADGFIFAVAHQRHRCSHCSCSVGRPVHFPLPCSRGLGAVCAVGRHVGAKQLQASPVSRDVRDVGTGLRGPLQLPDPLRCQSVIRQ